MVKHIAVIGIYEDRRELGVFDTRDEAYAAIGRYMVEYAEQNHSWCANEASIEEVDQV